MPSILDLPENPQPDQNEESAASPILLESPRPNLLPAPRSPGPSLYAFSSFLQGPPKFYPRRSPSIPAPKIPLPGLDSPPIMPIPRSRAPRPRSRTRLTRRHIVPPLYMQVLRKEGWKAARLRRVEAKERDMVEKRKREDDDENEVEEGLIMLEKRIKLLKEKIQATDTSKGAELIDVKKVDKGDHPAHDKLTDPNDLPTYRLHVDTCRDETKYQNAEGKRNVPDKPNLPFTGTPTNISAESSLPLRCPRGNSVVEQDFLDSAMDADDEHDAEHDDIDDPNAEVDFEDAYQSILLDENEDDCHSVFIENTNEVETFLSPSHVRVPSSNHTPLSDRKTLGEIARTYDTTTQDSAVDNHNASDSEKYSNSTIAPSSSPPIFLSLRNIVKTAKERAHERQQALIKKRGREAYEKHLKDDKERKKRKTSMNQTQEMDVESMKKDQEKRLMEQRSKRAFWTSVDTAGRLKRGHSRAERIGIGITFDQDEEC